VCGSDTGRWTRIFRLFFLSSRVTSFLTQFAYLMVSVAFLGQQVSFEKISTASQDNSATSNRRFQFNKRGQLFIRSDNETLTVVAMRVSEKDCSPAKIQA
jgi:hypothetical protein